MEVQKTNQNFGAIKIKTQEAKDLINCLPYENSINITVMKMDSAHNPVDVYVSTINKHGKERIKVEVGPKIFIQNFFSGIETTIRKGFNYANKLNLQQQAERKITKGMNFPTL